MLQWFCPRCSAPVAQSDRWCSRCGVDLRAASMRSYEAKLVDALHHVLPERRLMAARILGERADIASAAALIAALAGEADPYVAAELVRALAALHTPDAEEAIDKARRHPSVIVRQAAKTSRDRRRRA